MLQSSEERGVATGKGGRRAGASQVLAIRFLHPEGAHGAVSGSGFTRHLALCCTTLQGQRLTMAVISSCSATRWPGAAKERDTCLRSLQSERERGHCNATVRCTLWTTSQGASGSITMGGAPNLIWGRGGTKGSQRRGIYSESRRVCRS